MTKIVTEEQIEQALRESGMTVSNDYFYEVSASGFGMSLNLPRFRDRIQKYKIDGETKVSYVCGTKKINKKKLTYVDSYTGCTQRVVRGEDLISAIWMKCNKLTIIEMLRFVNDVDLYKELFERLKEFKECQ